MGVMSRLPKTNGARIKTCQCSKQIICIVNSPEEKLHFDHIWRVSPLQLCYVSSPLTPNMTKASASRKKKINKTTDKCFKNFMSSFGFIYSFQWKHSPVGNFPENVVQIFILFRIQKDHFLVKQIRSWEFGPINSQKYVHEMPLVIILRISTKSFYRSLI